MRAARGFRDWWRRDRATAIVLGVFLVCLGVIASVSRTAGQAESRRNCQRANLIVRYIADARKIQKRLKLPVVPEIERLTDRFVADYHAIGRCPAS